MPKDPRDHIRLLDKRDQAQTAAATRARQHVEPERPGHEGCPRLAPHHLSPPGCPGPQHAVLRDRVDPRSWHEHGQSRQKLNRVEHEVRRPITPRLPERIATQPLKPIPVSRRHHQPGVQIDAVPARVTAARLDGFLLRSYV